jgi:hypothetical protein
MEKKLKRRQENEGRQGVEVKARRPRSKAKTRRTK